MKISNVSARDERIVRNGKKIASVRGNAQYVREVRAEHGGFGHYLAAWPADDVVGLWDELKRRGQRLGGNSGPFFLRFVGKDTFMLSGRRGRPRWCGRRSSTRRPAARRRLRRCRTRSTSGVPRAVARLPKFPAHWRARWVSGHKAMTADTKHDVDQLLAAGRIVREAFERMKAAAVPGVTTAELDAIAARVFEARGARSAPQAMYDFPGVDLHQRQRTGGARHSGSAPVAGGRHGEHRRVGGVQRLHRRHGRVVRARTGRPGAHAHLSRRAARRHRSVATCSRGPLAERDRSYRAARGRSVTAIASSAISRAMASAAPCTKNRATYRATTRASDACYGAAWC